MTYLTIFFTREHGRAVSLQFQTEAEARHELRTRAGDMEVTGRYGGNIQWKDGTVRATYTLTYDS